MSIAINGMEMPINCSRCPCSDDETRFCRAANKYIPMLGKPEFCPLSTIEERKKGKWIEDAETFYKAVNEKGGGVDADTPYFTEDDIACSECLALFSVIDNCTESFNYCPNCGSYNGGEE